MNPENSKVPSKISNVNHIAYNAIRRNWGWWFVGLVVSLALIAYSVRDLWLAPKDPSVLTGFPLLFLILVLFVSAAWGEIAKWARGKFWVQFALAYGLHYAAEGNPAKESGIMFKQGIPRNITHVIEGVIGDQQFRMFEYHFGMKEGKSIRAHDYTVFAFKYSGIFPHIHLDRLNNAYGVSVGETIPVPPEFSKVFRLSAPRKYEIEALQIFTPDTLAYVLDIDLPYDVEFVGQELLLFTEGQIHNREELEKRFKLAKALNDHFDDILHKMRFAQVGTYSSSLVS